MMYIISTLIKINTAFHNNDATCNYRNYGSIPLLAILYVQGYGSTDGALRKRPEVVVKHRSPNMCFEGAAEVM